VFVNVTIDRDADGRPLGYFSVRRKPNRAGIEPITPVYPCFVAADNSA
jgi:hypothetical protein